MGKPMSYIQIQINQHGEDWINCIKPEDIQRSYKKIVKDMVKGIIDYEKHGKYFLDPKFLENLYIAVSSELEINRMNCVSCEFYYSTFPNTPNIGVHIHNLKHIIYVYEMICYKLDVVRNTGDIGVLTDTSGLLFQYRNYIV